MAEFIHLNTHSTYSLLQGIANPKKLATQAQDLGMPALGITDSGTVYGAVDISKNLPAAGIQPILGVQLPVWQPATQEARVLTLLAQDTTGWQNLLALVTLSNLDSAAQHIKCVELSAVLVRQAGLICLTGGARFGYFTPVLQHPQAQQDIQALHAAFGNRLYVEIQRHGLAVEQQTESQFLALADAHHIPLVATNDSRFLTPSQTEAYNALVCIGESLTLDDPSRTAYGPEYCLRPADEMVALFADLPEAVANTLLIPQRCGFWVEPVGVKEMFMPQWPVTEGTDADVIRTDAHAGLAQRLAQHVYPLHPVEQHPQLAADYQARLEEELAIIIPMGFAGYFLITADFIRWAKAQNIPVGPGRGSGAGSLVAWCLQITDLDPIRWDLYFERFLNPERVSLPDFDVDFCQERREEVIQYVQRKYGAGRVAQIITFGSLKARACIRDVGRVLQLPYGLVNKIAAFVPEGPNPPSIQDVLADDERLRQLAQQEPGVQQVLDIAVELEGCLRHASTHAAGVIIADRPIVEVCGLYHDPRAALPATQFSMYDAEYAGLVKFDFLGLKTLTQIQKTCALVQVNHGITIDPLLIPLDDAQAYDMLCAGHTVGVFQIESAGMTDMTKRMVPRDMEALSALVALYRPGPLGSGMVDDYIAVRHGKKETVYPHPILAPVLQDTFGVPVYQEQIMRMARDMAGYSLGGADMLRRAMGKKKPAEMDQQREIFITGAATHHQIAPDAAHKIFDLMAVFAGYGFNKAHSMAYALISYQTAYLKAHYPLEFMAATMTLDRGNTDKLLRYKQELHRMGAKLLPPCVNASGVYFTVAGGDIRHALAAVKGAGEEAVTHMVAERTTNGVYQSLWQFLERQGEGVLNRKQLEVLIKAGAFDALNRARGVLCAHLDSLLLYAQGCSAAKQSDQIGLFGGGAVEFPPIPKLAAVKPWNTLETLQHEQATIGFFLTAHPLDAFGYELQHLPNRRLLTDLASACEQGQTRATVAAVIMQIREVRTKSGSRMGIVLLSDETGQSEAVLFPESYSQYYDDLVLYQPYQFELALSLDGERQRINVERMVPLSQIAERRPKLTLQIQRPEVLQPLHALLTAQPGQTECTLILPRGAQHIRVKLPQRVRCNHQLLQELQALDGVRVR